MGRPKREPVAAARPGKRSRDDAAEDAGSTTGDDETFALTTIETSTGEEVALPFRGVDPSIPVGSKEWKRAKRLADNRASAARSRALQKNHNEETERKLAELIHANEKLRQENARLKARMRGADEPVLAAPTALASTATSRADCTAAPASKSIKVAPGASKRRGGSAAAASASFEASASSEFSASFEACSVGSGESGSAASASSAAAALPGLMSRLTWARGGTAAAGPAAAGVQQPPALLPGVLCGGGGYLPRFSSFGSSNGACSSKEAAPAADGGRGHWEGHFVTPTEEEDATGNGPLTLRQLSSGSSSPLLLSGCSSLNDHEEDAEDEFFGLSSSSSKAGGSGVWEAAAGPISLAPSSSNPSSRPPQRLPTLQQRVAAGQHHHGRQRPPTSTAAALLGMAFCVAMFATSAPGPGPSRFPQHAGTSGHAGAAGGGAPGEELDNGADDEGGLGRAGESFGFEDGVPFSRGGGAGSRSLVLSGNDWDDDDDDDDEEEEEEDEEEGIGPGGAVGLHSSKRPRRLLHPAPSPGASSLPSPFAHRPSPSLRAGGEPEAAREAEAIMLRRQGKVLRRWGVELQMLPLGSGTSPRALARAAAAGEVSGAQQGGLLATLGSALRAGAASVVHAAGRWGAAAPVVPSLLLQPPGAQQAALCPELQLSSPGAPLGLFGGDCCVGVGALPADGISAVHSRLAEAAAGEPELAGSLLRLLAFAAPPHGASSPLGWEDALAFGPSLWAPGGVGGVTSAGGPMGPGLGGGGGGGGAWQSLPGAASVAASFAQRQRGPRRQQQQQWQRASDLTRLFSALGCHAALFFGLLVTSFWSSGGSVSGASPGPGPLYVDAAGGPAEKGKAGAPQTEAPHLPPLPELDGMVPWVDPTDGGLGSGSSGGLLPPAPEDWLTM